MQYESLERPSPNGDYDDTPIGIVALGRLMWRNRWWIIVPTLGLPILTAMIVMFFDDVYSAEAQVVLTRGNLEIIDTIGTGELDVSSGAIANAMTIFPSRTVALRVVERLDLTNDPEINPNLEAREPGEDREPYSDAEVRQFALDWLSKVAQITPVPDTNIIAVRAETTDPDKSAAVANAYTEAYLEYQSELWRGETERAAQALAARVNELSLQLEEDQKALQTYRATVQNATSEGAEALALEASGLRDRLQIAETTLTELDSLLVALDIAADGDANTLRTLITSSEALSRMAVTALNGPLPDSIVAADIDALRSATMTERQRVSRLSDALRRGRDALEARMALADEVSLRLRQLEVELETTSQVHEASLARLKQLSIQAELADAGAQVLSHAEPPLDNAPMGRRRSVAIAAFLGFFLSMAYVLFREAANDRVRSAGELADLTGSSPVVQIPRAGKPSADKTPFHEGIRSLRQHLLSSADSAPEGVAIGVFAALPQEDTSSVTIALAQSFTTIGKRVVVVDANMRLGTVTGTFDTPSDAPGLRNAIVKSVTLAGTLIPVPDAGLDLLPAGNSQENPADLLASSGFAEIVADLRARYDVVLIDTPPILVAPDAATVARHVDQHVFLAANGRSTRASVHDAVAALRHAASFDDTSGALRRPRAGNRRTWQKLPAGGKPINLVVALCDAQEAFGREYGVSKSVSDRYYA